MTGGAKRYLMRDALAIPAAGAAVLVAGSALVFGFSPVEGSAVAMLLGVATFLYGIMVGFAIEGTRQRLAKLQEYVKRCDANLLNISVLLGVFGEARAQIMEMIDLNLQEQLDYPLTDFHQSGESSLRIADAVRDLKPARARQEIAYDHLLLTVTDLGTNRTLVETTVGQRIGGIEWVGLGLLMIVQLVLLVFVAAGSIPGALFGGAMAAVLVTFTLLLVRLDRLRWQEQTWIWVPIERLFMNLGFLPYFPESVVKEGRYRPHGKVRLGSDIDGPGGPAAKKIRIVELP